MPIKKGPIDAAMWRMLAVSLKWDGYFPRRGVGGNAFDFLWLLQNEPEAAKAVEAVYRDTTWPQAELYSCSVGKEKHRFVFGSKSRKLNTKELFYPRNIDGGLENSLLLNAVLEAQQNLLSFLWHQESGRMFVFAYPLVACYPAIIGWMASSSVQPGVMDSFIGAVTVCCYVVAAAIVFYPWTWGWWKRHALRRALKKMGSAAVAEATASFNALFRPRT